LKKPKTPRPILGTANFGTPYGLLSNKVLDYPQLQGLILTAIELGIETLDTAESYLESQKFISSLGRGLFKGIHTKINIGKRSYKDICQAIENQIQIFKSQNVSRILAHDWQKATKIEKINFHRSSLQFPEIDFGVSVYEVDELVDCLQYFSNFRAFQIPYSLVDQRFRKFLSNSSLKNRPLFTARSIFLQGALDSRLPSNPFSKHPNILGINSLLNSTQLTLDELVIAFLKQSGVEEFVFGSVQKEQISGIVAALHKKYSPLDFKGLHSDDRNLTDPRKWKTKF